MNRLNRHNLKHPLWRLVALFVCAALCAVSCGCSARSVDGEASLSEVSASQTAAKGTKPTDTTPSDTIENENTALGDETPALCFDKGDSLSPYAAKTRVNRALSPLLYEGLTTVQRDFSAKPCLAEQIRRTDKTHLTVTLKNNIKFSENSPLKAADVAASFLLAARSEAYAGLVADVVSVRAKDDRTLLVTLSSAVPFYEQALSFPVIKAVGSRVVGTGAYRLNAKKNALELNPYANHRETAPKLSAFHLKAVSRRQEQQFALETGEISLYTDDLSLGAVPRTVTDVKLASATLPYLVYLGFNANRAPWSSAAIRASVCSAVSRTDVAAVGFSGFAEPTATPFCPAFTGVKEGQGASLTQNVAAAVAVWKKNGYNVAENGVVKNRLVAELVCQKQNPMHRAAAGEIAKELKAAGMQVTVAALSESEYRARLSSGGFDFYLGEVRLPNTLSLDAVLSAAGRASYGVSAGGRTLWAQYKQGALSAEAFVSAFQKEAPFLPLCYAQGVTLSSKRLSGVSPSGVSAFDGFEQWNYT